MKGHTKGEKVPLKEIGNTATRYSSLASTVIHQLIIAGIGIIWILNRDFSPKEIVAKCHPLLLFAFSSFVLAIFCIILQYAIVAICYDKYYHREKDKLEKDNNTSALNVGQSPINQDNDICETLVTDPAILESLTWIGFKGKILFMILGYASIFVFLIARIAGSF